MSETDDASLTIEDLLAFAGGEGALASSDEPGVRQAPLAAADAACVEGAWPQKADVSADAPDSLPPASNDPDPLCAPAPLDDPLPAAAASGTALEGTACPSPNPAGSTAPPESRRPVRGAVLVVTLAAIALAAVALAAPALWPPSQEDPPEAKGGSAASQPSGDPAPASAATLRYTVAGEEGVSYGVRETVSFDAEGRCTSTEFEADLDSPDAAEDLAAGMRQSYGARCLSLQVEGTVVRATLDVSPLGYDERAYEEAVRASAPDLVVENA